MAIATIQRGMQFGEVFAIINQVIAKLNQLETAVGDSLTNGVLDYNKLGNKPLINGVVLVGDRAQAELAIAADETTLQAVRDIGIQMDGITSERQGYVLRLATLEEYRTSDIARVLVLEGEKTQRDNQVGNLVAESALIVAASNQASTAKNEAVAAKNDAVAAKNSAQQYANNLANDIQRLDNLVLVVGYASEQDKPGTGIIRDIEVVTEKIGNVGDKVSITSDLKETREKTNDVIQKLIDKGAFATADVDKLDVNYN